MDQARCAKLPQDLRRFVRLFGTVIGDAHIQRLPLPDDVIERHHRFIERRIRVKSVTVENIDVFQPHALKALVKAGDHVFARTPFAVRPGPHVIARFRRNDQFVAVRVQILRKDTPKVRLSRTGGRPIVVRQVEVRDAEVERAVNDRAAGFQRVHAAEVVP